MIEFLSDPFVFGLTVGFTGGVAYMLLWQWVFNRALRSGG